MPRRRFRYRRLQSARRGVRYRRLQAASEEPPASAQAIQNASTIAVTTVLATSLAIRSNELRCWSTNEELSIVPVPWLSSYSPVNDSASLAHSEWFARVS